MKYTNQKVIKVASLLIVVIAVAIVGILYAFTYKKSSAALVSAVPAATAIANQSKAASPVTDASPVPILVYHRFGTPDAHASKMQIHYFISPENFKLQMQYLKDHGYTTITFNTLVDHYLNGTTIPNKSIVLTFDDGWRSQYEDAVPVLKQFGFTGSFFIITSYETYPAYMTWDMIKDLDKSGFEIGSHTVHHVNLAKIDLVKANTEVVDSKKTLEQELGHPITTFVYPEYGTNVAVQKLLKDAGYLGARAGWTRTVNSKSTIFDLKSQEAVNNPNPFAGE